MAVDELDTDVHAALKEVLAEYPIQLGLLVGSHATGTAGPHSDIDMAVEFDPSYSAAKRQQLRLSLIAALTQELATGDLDLVVLNTVRPAVGRSVLQDAVVIVGDQQRVDQLLKRFDRQAPTATPEQRRDRFDAALRRLEEQV